MPKLQSTRKVKHIILSVSLQSALPEIQGRRLWLQKCGTSFYAMSSPLTIPLEDGTALYMLYNERKQILPVKSNKKYRTLNINELFALSHVKQLVPFTFQWEIN